MGLGHIQFQQSSGEVRMSENEASTRFDVTIFLFTPIVLANY